MDSVDGCMVDSSMYCGTATGFQRSQSAAAASTTSKEEEESEEEQEDEEESAIARRPMGRCHDVTACDCLCCDLIGCRDMHASMHAQQHD